MKSQQNRIELVTRPGIATYVRSCMCTVPKCLAVTYRLVLGDLLELVVLEVDRLEASVVPSPLDSLGLFQLDGAKR